MNMRRTARKAVGVVAMASVVALALAGCSRGGGGNDETGGATASSPGITDTEVTIGITTPLSGATAGPGTCTVAGVTAYFGEKNDKDGGVNKDCSFYSMRACQRSASGVGGSCAPNRTGARTTAI